MASLFKLGDRWVADVFKRGRIRLGKNKSDALFLFRHIEKLEQAQRAGLPPEPATLDWLRNVAPKLNERLRELGLVETKLGRSLGDLVEAFGAQGGKAASVRIRKNATDKILAFFGADTALVDIRAPDAQAYRNWLATKGNRGAKGLAPATLARHVKWARGLFRYGERLKWVSANPFSDIVAGKMSNPSRAFYVDRALAQRIADELVGAEMRLIFALGRWGGLRLPSEVVNFRWSNVDWATWSMTFTTCKTEAYEGLEARTCPIFKELQPFFLAASEGAKEGDDFIFSELRDSSKDARQFIAHRIEKAIKRLGVKPWPRLLSNLRATRATEVDKAFGSKAESLWIGHGAVVALKHYLMVIDDDWEKATGVARVEDSKAKQPF